MYQTARSLMAFRRGEDDDWAWSGALTVADALDDLRMVRNFCEGVAGVKAHRQKK